MAESRYLRGDFTILKKNNEADRILRDFMNNATHDEIRELERLLKRRSAANRNGIPDPGAMAKELSSQIQSRMGLTDANVRSMARELVTKLAREHKPDITPSELENLIERMVPSYGSPGRSVPNLPPQILKTMIIQFVLYSRNEMTAEEIANLPEGWAEKYWRVFPPDVKRLISTFIKGGIDRKNFWKRIKEAIGA